MKTRASRVATVTDNVRHNQIEQIRTAVAQLQEHLHAMLNKANADAAAD